MDTAKREAVIRLLAVDALEATADNGGEAAVLLIDAAMSLALTRLGAVGAHEMSGLFIGHILQQGNAILAQNGKRLK